VFETFGIESAINEGDNWVVVNEETTQNLPDRRPFEERVLARFDAFDARFDSIDARLEKLEMRSYDTKPIWERALAAINEVRSEIYQLNARVGTIETRVSAIETKLGAIETKVGAIETRVIAIENKVNVIETRVGAMESQVTGLRSDQASMWHELLDTQRDFKRTLTRLLENLVSFLTDTRDLMRDNDARLKLLESKLT